MSSGLAPGSAADTWIAERSTRGNEATGRYRKAIMPANATLMANSVVATGLFMNGAEKFISAPPHLASPETICEIRAVVPVCRRRCRSPELYRASKPGSEGVHPPLRYLKDVEVQSQCLSRRLAELLQRGLPASSS